MRARSQRHICVYVYHMHEHEARARPAKSLRARVHSSHTATGIELIVRMYQY